MSENGERRPEVSVSGQAGSQLDTATPVQKPPTKASAEPAQPTQSPEPAQPAEQLKQTTQAQRAQEQAQTQLSFRESLKKEFGLNDSQINQLRANGVDVDKFSDDDLADREKVQTLIEGLKQIDGLNGEQKVKIDQFEQELTQALSPEGQAQAKESLRQKIAAKRKEIQKSTDLTPAEKEKALAELDEIERTLEQSEKAKGQEEELTDEQKKAKRQQEITRVKAKAKEYLQYAGLGISLLFFILFLKSANGGNRGGGT
ncbi:MAG: hypothetical protein N2482_03005 [Patescibacteria group bacterium]|nr:hypothetical protein [Patescibacteria group bacterium]